MSTAGCKDFVNYWIEYLHIFKSYSVEFKFTIFELPNNLRKCWKSGGIFFLLVYIYIFNCTTVCNTGGNAGEWVAQLKKMSLLVLIVNYRCRTLYWPKQAQIILLQCLNVTPFSLLFFFASSANVCHIIDIKKGAGDRKLWSCVLKLSLFLGRHIIKIAGMRNPDAEAGSAINLYDRVPSSPTCDYCMKPRQGRLVGEMSTRAKLSSRILCF